MPEPLDLPSAIESSTAAVVGRYADAEQRLVAGSAVLVGQYLADGSPRADQALQTALRTVGRRILGTLADAPTLAQTLGVDAARAGNLAAIKEVTDALRNYPRVREVYTRNIGDTTPHGLRAAAYIAAELTDRLTATHHRILRFTDDAYRAATAQAAIGQVIGGTPQLAQREAWRKLTENGVTGFKDTAGRDWELSTYVEMAARTAAIGAFNASHQDRMQALGIGYWTVGPTGFPCKLCLPWEGKVLANSGAGSYVEEHAAQDRKVTVNVAGTLEEARAAGLQHPNCFPAETLVRSTSGVLAADSRWYEGQMVVINTASGEELSVTPNHPVLTPEGWIPAGQLVVGQNVLRHGVQVETVVSGDPHDVQVPTPIGDVFDALSKSVEVSAVSVPAAAENFHGDGEGSDVEVVLSNRLLQHGGIDTLGSEGGSQTALEVGGVGFPELLGSGSLDEIGLASGHAPDGLMGGGGHGGTLCAAHASIAAESGLGFGDVGAPAEHPTADSGLTDSEGGRDLALSLAGEVSLDSIVNIRTREFAGHVYNLQSGSGWYVAGSIVVHNCKHTLVAYFPGVTALKTRTPEEITDATERFKETQRLRAMERAVRMAKMAEQAALTDLDKAAARRRARDIQAKIREYTARTGLNRRPRREQLHLANK